MKRALATLAIGAVLAPAAALAAGGAHVRLASYAAGSVRGTGFHARERVVVTVRAGRTTVVQATTSSASGAFTMKLERALPAGGCDGVAVSAVGARGDRAAWKTPARPCGTPLAP